MLAAGAACGVAAEMPGPEAIRIVTRAVPLDTDDPARQSVGRLRFQGGLALASADRRLGGVSGMRFLPDGRLIAVTDAGDLLRLEIIETAGRLSGVRSATIARLTDERGLPIRGKADADAEALELEGDRILIAFERDHRVWVYAPGADKPRLLAFPDRPWLMRLPANGGIEAMARVGGSRLFLAEERGPDPYNGILQARADGGGDNAYGRLDYEVGEAFRPTDAAALDESTILVLHRRFSPLSGVSGLLVAVPVDRNRLVLGPPTELARFEPPLSVDNFEALAVRREGGRTFVYIASDDNFSPLQRTLLLKFELTP